MNRLDPNNLEFLRWIDDQKLAEREPLLLLALILTLLVVLLAILSLRRTVRTQTTPSLGRVNSTLQDLTVRLNDIASRQASEGIRLSEEAKKLNERLSKLEHEFALLTRRSYEQFQKDVSRHPTPEKASTEKKTAELDQTPAENVSIAPRQTATHAAAAETSSFTAGMEKSRGGLFSRLRSLLGGKGIDESVFEALEETLIGSDLGVNTAKNFIARLRSELSQSGPLSEEAVRALLREQLRSVFTETATTEILPEKVAGKPKVILIVGVNGVGKTTTIGKLASRFQSQGAKIVLGACDTFRAGAVEQLRIWADRVQVPLVSGEEGAKPSTIAFQTIHRGLESNADVVIIDTAGRLHTRTNLMNELASVIKIIEREQPGAPHETLLVLDASTGQNALQQAREFHAVTNLTGVVVTKLDGTPRGGIVVAIRNELGVPVRYVGLGEGISDLRPFDAKTFIDALLPDSTGGMEVETASPIGERAAVRRRRREGVEPSVH